MIPRPPPRALIAPVMATVLLWVGVAHGRVDLVEGDKVRLSLDG